MSINLAVDIGGSFTDVALLKSGVLYSAKAATTVSPDEGVIKGIEDVLSQTLTQWPDIDRFVLGTTLATNALIERKGVKTALVTTEGFTDIVEIARENRYAQYDINMRRAEPLVPRNLRFGIPERIDYQGRVVLPLDEKACWDLARKLAELQVESVAVCLLQSFVNEVHERRIREIILDVNPRVSISLSCEVCPEIREYERTSTVCANAYVQPIIARALDKLDAVLKGRGLRCPLFLMASSGALCSLDLSRRQPVKLVESGPAGGAIFAAHVARQCGVDKAIEFDMGGTTAKVSFIENFEPVESRSFEFGRAYRFLKGSGQPIRIPVIEMVEIGAGGGSIAHVDDLGRLRVGPQSAVSNPGPACFGQGGLEPTVTDSNCVLNYLDVEQFAAGQIRLDPQAAQVAMQSKLGPRLNLSDGQELATMVSEVVTENMSSVTRVHGIELGHDVGDFTAIAIGGGGPLHIGRIARKLGIKRMIVPTEASVGSAVGFLVAPIQYNVVRSVPGWLETIPLDSLRQLLDEMSTEASGEVKRGLGGLQTSIDIRAGAYMRYRGQGYEIKVSFAGIPLDESFRDAARKAFETEYQRLYHRVIPRMSVEFVTFFATASAMPESDSQIRQADLDLVHENVYRERQIYLADGINAQGQVTVKDYVRNTLRPGYSFEGPALVSERHTTTLVPGGFKVRVDSHHYLILEKV